MIYGNVIGGAGQAQTYILVDENGNEIPAVLVDNEVVFDATANDIRLGKVAATESGVTTGEKDIPAYHTTVGYAAIPKGQEFKIKIPQGERYNYTKLQAIVCLYGGSMAKSVAAEKVCINDSVYAVGSAEALAPVTVDSENKTIKLGITNEGSTPCVLRYFTYKEEP